MRALRATRLPTDSLAKLIVVIVLLGTVISAELFHGVYERTFIASDGVGYYSYLPMLMVHHSLETAAGFPPNSAPGLYGASVSPNTGRLSNQYPIGTALCEAPFFLAGHLAARILGFPMDGWSKPYQWSVALAGISWFCVGVLALWSVLIRRFSYWSSAVAILGAVFGTSLFHYAVIEPSMSHVYAFAMIAALLWLSDRFWDRPSARMAVGIGLSCGVLFSIRNMDLVYASACFYPALLPQNRSLARRYMWFWVGGFMIGVLPQLASSTYYLGVPWANTYWGAPLAWSHPRLGTVLLSASRGWWFWSPLSAIGVFGLIVGLWNSAWRTFATVGLGSLAVVTYIFSCWSDITFGCGFGNRMYVDAVPLIALGLGMTTTCIPARVVSKVTLWLVALNILLMFQYWNGEIPCANTTPSIYREALTQPLAAFLGVQYGDSREPAGLAGTITIVESQRDGTDLRIGLSARNVGTSKWRSALGKGTVNLAGRIFATPSCSGTAYGEWRFPVPKDVLPDQDVQLIATIRGSTMSRKYGFFCWELMADSVTWFRDVGPSSPAVMELDENSNPVVRR